MNQGKDKGLDFCVVQHTSADGALWGFSSTTSSLCPLRWSLWPLFDISLSRSLCCAAVQPPWTTNFSIAAVPRSVGSHALQPYYKRQPHPLCRLAAVLFHHPPSYDRGPVRISSIRLQLPPYFPISRRFSTLDGEAAPSLRACYDELFYNYRCKRLSFERQRHVEVCLSLLPFSLHAPSRPQPNGHVELTP